MAKTYVLNFLNFFYFPYFPYFGMLSSFTFPLLPSILSAT